jgi:hypothetical protein
VALQDIAAREGVAAERAHVWAVTCLWREVRAGELSRGQARGSERHLRLRRWRVRCHVRANDLAQ